MMEFIAVLFFGLMMAGYPCCCGPKCNCCSDASPSSKAKRTYTITFTGVGNGSCGTCNDWNTTAWIVRDFTQTGSFLCHWELADSLPCTADLIDFQFSCNAPGIPGIGVFSSFVRIFHYADGGQDGYFRIATSTTPIDCADPGAQAYYSTLSNNTRCDWSGASCDVG